MTTERRVRLSWGTRIDLLVNSVTLLVAVLTVTFIVHSYQTQTPRPPKVVAGITRGMVAPRLQGISYAKENQTLVLLLRSSCPYCRAEVPFYKQAVEVARRSGRTQVVAVFAARDIGASGFLADNDIAAGLTVVPDSQAFKAYATPTLLLVDHQGHVSDFWVGAVQGPTAELILRKL
jgi:hypothetical protein